MKKWISIQAVLLLVLTTFAFGATAPTRLSAKLNGADATGGYITVEMATLTTMTFESVWENNGDDSPANYNGIAYSFPSFTSTTYKANVANGSSSSDLTYGEYFGSEAGGGDAYANYVMVEAVDNNGWDGSDYLSAENNTFAVTVTPLAYGTFDIYYRAAASNTTSWTSGWTYVPSSSSYTDCLGFKTYRLRVTINAPKPDLTVTTPTAPTSAVLGESISVSCVVSNSGAGSSGTSYVGYYISTSQYGSETYLDEDYVSTLSSGSTSSESQSVTIPTNLTPGNYYITFFADHENSVSESNEGNNINSKAITILALPSYTVNVKNSSGTFIDGSEINSLELYKNGVLNNTVDPSSGQYKFSNLAISTTYKIDAYCTDMYVGFVEEYLTSGENASETITVPNSGTLRVKVYYADGVTPLENVYVEARSHEGTAWRSGTSLSTGFVSWGGSSVAYLFPNSQTGEYWYVYCFLNSSQVATAKSVNITSGNETSITITTTVPAKGDINVTVKNIDGGLTTIPTSNARVVLYNNSNPWVYITEDQTNSSAIANFTDINFQTLNVEAYHNPTNPPTIFGEEYWGSIQFLHDRDPKNIELKRNEPYIESCFVYNKSTGQNVTGGVVYINTPLRIEVKVKNASSGYRDIRSRVVVDRDKILGFDFDSQLSSLVGVSAGGYNVFSFDFTPVNLGIYYQVPGTQTRFFNGSIYTYPYTDGHSWTNDPFFTVEPPKGNLSVTVNNVSGALADDGTIVTLKDDGTEIQHEYTIGGNVTFTQIPATTYDMISVLHPNPNSIYPEFWGQKGPLTVTLGNTTETTFIRYMPYVSGIEVANLDNVNKYSFTIGDSVKIRIKIQNNDVVAHNSMMRFMVDRDKVEPYDFPESGYIGPVILQAQNSNYIEYVIQPQNLGSYYVRPIKIFSDNDLTDTYGWEVNPHFEVVESTKPLASGSDISQQPLFLYPETSEYYQIKAKYFDPSGANDIKIVKLKFDHPTSTEHDIVITKDLLTGTETNDIYVSDFDIVKSSIIYNAYGDEGYEITWKFKITDGGQWDKISEGIKFAVQVIDNEGQSSEWSLNNSNSSFKQYGTTVLTHGWQHLFLNGFEWTDPMAIAIKARLGGNADIFRYDRATNSFEESKYIGYDEINKIHIWEPTKTSNASKATDREKILLFEWKVESNENYEGHSEAAGDALTGLLLKGEKENLWALDHLHLIGHSRGTVVMSEVAHRLLTFGKNVEQVTSLDPHDWGVEGLIDLTTDKKVNPELVVDIDPATYNGHNPNSGVCSWEGVAWHDNYWHFGSIGDLGGRGIQGAYNIEFPQSGFTHSDIHEWYRGTIDKNPDDPTWYSQSIEDKTINDGFEYSRIGYKNGQKINQSNYLNKTQLCYKIDEEGIFNGDFAFGTYTSKNTVPGWTGYNKDSQEANLTIYNNLFLNSDYPKAKHNSFFIPQEKSKIYFNFTTIYTAVLENNDMLKVYLDDGTNCFKIINVTDYHYGELEYLDVSSYSNSVHTLTFELYESKSKTISSTVIIDNVSFEIDTNPLMPTNLAESFPITTKPLLSWSSFLNGGDGETQIGYQARMYRVSDNHPVYDTGFISSTNANSHQYSPGTYTGIDPVTNVDRVSEVLSVGTLYSWQVRYRDSGNDWSFWAADPEIGGTIHTFTVPANPFITISSPTDATKWQIGTEYTIQWDSNLSGNCMITLWKGTSIVNSIINSTLLANDSYKWTVPALTPGSDYRIRIQSEVNQLVDDYSDYFEIVAQPVASYIVLTEPDEGEDWVAGTTERINWDHNITGNVKIDLYLNNSPYQTLFSSVANQTNSSGYIDWNIDPGMEGRDDYRIKVTSLVNSEVSGQSDLFSIEAQKINVTSPLAGEFWQKYVEHQIKWSDNIAENVKIELMKNSTLIRTIYSSTESDGFFLWTPDLSIPVGQYTIKISSTSNPSIIGSSGVFDLTLEPPPPFITLSAPNGGEQWQAGNPYNITWADNFDENVIIELFKNDISFSTIADNEASDGSYTWNISGTHFTGSDFKVKITSIDPAVKTDKLKSISELKATVSCISAAPFTINEPFYISGVGLISSHDVYAATVDSLEWEDNLDEYVKIELYKGTTFITILKELTPSDGSEEWVVPEGLSGSDYRFKITSVNNEGITSYSDYFTIIIPELVSPVPALPINNSFISDKSPLFDWNEVENATEYVMMIDDNSTFTSPDSIIVTQSTYTSTVDLSLGTYYWKLRSRKPTFSSFYSITYKFTIGNTPIPPKLSVPANGSSFADLTPYLNWSDVTTATSYRILVDNSTDYSTPVYDQIVSVSEFTPAIDLNLGTYYWKVYAVNDFGSSSSTVTWTFNIGEVPSAPKLYSPSNYSYLTEPKPSFDWSDIAGATGYRIIIDNDEDFTSPVINVTNALSTYNPADSLALGTYYWKTAAINQYGESLFSSRWQFLIELPLSVPNNVQINVAANTVTVTWDTVDRATHYLVYTCTQPYGVFSYAGNVTTNSYQVPLSEVKLFYYIVASSEPYTKTGTLEVDKTVKAR